MRTLARGTIAAALLLAAPLARAATCENGWAVVASPDLSRRGDNVLKAVAGVAEDDVWAVGQYAPDSDPNVLQALAVHYDGTRWSAVPTPDAGTQANSLQALATFSPGAAVAVGYHIDDTTFFARTLIETWNGSAWALASNPEPGASAHLFGVAGTGPSDIWAVGDQQPVIGTLQTLIEHFDGTQWSIVASPNPGDAGNVLYGVSARAADDVWAVGAQTNTGGPDRALLLHWNGSAWQSVVSPPDDAASLGLYAVAAGPNATTAVGGAQNDQAGRTLALIEAGTPPALAKVASSPAGDDTLFAVASTPAEDWAVGSTVVWNGTGVPTTLIEHRVGGAPDWGIVPSPNPVPTGENQLGGVAVVGRTVWVVGEHDGAAGLRSLIAHSCR